MADQPEVPLNIHRCLVLPEPSSEKLFTEGDKELNRKNEWKSVQKNL
jgi:hypothetical protein